MKRAQAKALRVIGSVCFLLGAFFLVFVQFEIWNLSQTWQRFALSALAQSLIILVLCTALLSCAIDRIVVVRDLEIAIEKRFSRVVRNIVAGIFLIATYVVMLHARALTSGVSWASRPYVIGSIFSWLVSGLGVWYAWVLAVRNSDKHFIDSVQVNEIKMSIRTSSPDSGELNQSPYKLLVLLDCDEIRFGVWLLKLLLASGESVRKKRI